MMKGRETALSEGKSHHKPGDVAEDGRTTVDPQDLDRNIHDWLSTPDDVPVTQPPWEETDGRASTAETVDDPPAAVPRADGTSPPPPMLVSAPWGTVPPPHQSQPPGNDEPEAVIRARPSVLFAIEPGRLNLVTAGGAPFKVPLARISLVSVARVGDSWLCDLVHGVHRAGTRQVVEAVRLQADTLDFGRLLPEPAGVLAVDFEAFVQQLRHALGHARFRPPVGEAIPRLEDLDAYEEDLIRLCAGGE